MKNFFRVYSDYCCKYGFKSSCGHFYDSCLCNIMSHGTTAADALIFSSAVVQDGNPEDIDAIHHFRVKK